MQRIEIYFDFQGLYGIRQKPILIQEHRVLLIKKTIFEVHVKWFTSEESTLYYLCHT